MGESTDAVILWGLSISTWVQIGIAFVGFPAVVYELIQVTKGLRSTARASVYEFSARIKEALIANPDLLPYFDEGEEVSSEDPSYLKVMAIADLYAIYLELIATQSEGISAANKAAWSRYVQRVWSESPAVRMQIGRRAEEFSTEFWDLVKLDGYHDLMTAEAENVGDAHS